MKISKKVESRLRAVVSMSTIRTYRGKHVKHCQCYECLRKKVADYEARTYQALRGGARITRAEQTVPVRAHFRAQPHYLAHDPLLREAVESILREILAQSIKKTA